jgi:RimJ/RimL family protein N-acetyltransferase
MTLLAPLAPEHAAALQPLLEDAAIAATTPFPHPYPPNGAEAYVAEAMALRTAGTKYVFAVLAPDGAPVGMSLLKDVDQGHRTGELGYWIGRPWWGRGLATAAAGATLGFGFSALGLERIQAVCLAENPASLRVLAKLGFEEVERFEERLQKWPAPRTSVRLTLARQVWAAAPGPG